MKKSSKLLPIIATVWATVVLALGIWWLYLIVLFEKRLSEHTDTQFKNIGRLVKYEGATFFILIIGLTGLILYLFVRDRRKNRALHAFFASMTHELKTPLASVRLQAEVIFDLLKDNENKRISTLAERLIDDTQNLENQMDKSLQLARIERGGALACTDIELEEFFTKITQLWAKELTITYVGEFNSIRADYFALEIIFRNLFENTRIHSQKPNVQISFIENGDSVEISYQDHGSFQGDSSKLGTLFYKHESSHGSGIGIYLIKKLTLAMNGQCEIKASPFEVTIKLGKAHGA